MVAEIIVLPYNIITYGSSGWTASKNELRVKTTAKNSLRDRTVAKRLLCGAS